MITKERLRELIAQNATIYLQNFRGKIIPYTLNENINNALNYYNVDNKCLYLMKITNNEEDDCERAWLLDKLFGTKEEAEFALRFKRIPRTEELSLPTWEEFCELDDMFIFYCKEKIYCVGRTNDKTLESEYIGITCHDIDAFGESYSYSIFIEEATKENYLKACEICRKLWLGEEI